MSWAADGQVQHHARLPFVAKRLIINLVPERLPREPEDRLLVTQNLTSKLMGGKHHKLSAYRHQSSLSAPYTWLASQESTTLEGQAKKTDFAMACESYRS